MFSSSAINGSESAYKSAALDPASEALATPMPTFQAVDVAGVAAAVARLRT